MDATDRLGTRRAALVLALSALALLPSLGGAARLSYHEAIWAQSAREMAGTGDRLIPTLDGRPWLEKPPLGTWLIAASRRLLGESEASARLPSAVAAALLALAVARLAARRLGADLGLLAGCVQATTCWAVARGRLAEADILLAAIVAWAFLALDRVRLGEARWRWAFFALLGASSLAKGVGFGAALILGATAALLVWDRDRRAFRALLSPIGWCLAALVALAWPLSALARHPGALALWVGHVADRLAARPEHLQLAGERWWEYALSPLAQTLPWTPLAFLGARISVRRPMPPGGLDRLLWAWAVVPSLMVSTSGVRNAHYLIYALPPCSVWAAIGLRKLSERRRAPTYLFAALGLSIAAYYTLLAPTLDRRGREWAYYIRAGKLAPAETPLVLLYDDWDRLPYPTPFGPFPHDLAVRLYYLGRPATWRPSPDALRSHPPDAPTFDVVARERDRPSLEALGSVEVLSRGPTARWDRSFAVYRVASPPRVARGIDPGARPGYPRSPPTSSRADP